MIEGAGTISTNTDSCNAIDNTQNACSYIKSTLCCNAVTNAMTKNILDIGCAYVDIKDPGQSVDTSSIQSCDLSNSQECQQEQTTEVKQKSTQKSKASVSGSPAMIIAAVVFGIIALFFIYKKLKGKSPPPPLPPQSA